MTETTNRVLLIYSIEIKRKTTVKNKWEKILIETYRSKNSYFLIYIYNFASIATLLKHLFTNGDGALN